MTGDKPFLIAPGYEKEVLQSLAEELSKELSKELSIERVLANDKVDPLASNFVSAAEPKTIAFEGEVTPQDVEPDLPANSRIVAVDRDDSRAFSIPGQGMKGSATICIVFATAWLILTSVFALAIASGAGGGQLKPIFWLVLLFFSLLMSVGIGILVLGINLARRSVMIGILDDQVFVERKSIFGTKWIEVPKSALLDVRLGPSGTTINDQPVNELQFHTYDGVTHGMLSQLDDREIKWLAFQLNKILDLESFNAEGYELAATNDPNWPEPPGDSKVRLTTNTAAEKQIVVPGLGLMGGFGIWLMIFVLFAIPVVGSNFVKDFPLMFWLVLIPLGLLLLISNLIYRLRAFEFVVTQGFLTVNRSGILGKRTFQWPASEVTDVQMSHAGQVNNKTQRRLQISNGHKTLLNCLTGRSPKDILFVMTHLRQTLQLY